LNPVNGNACALTAAVEVVEVVVVWAGVIVVVVGFVSCFFLALCFGLASSSFGATSLELVEVEVLSVGVAL